MQRMLVQKHFRMVIIPVTIAFPEHRICEQVVLKIQLVKQKPYQND